ncbi:GIY-YIG nuclease family protein [Terrimonas sp. NA20]|uniref:GIY-YIG nuclease family protein n=2 Tax=Terrimonas ginsenosidimutans TaxID=2908004 RepID=A0ABS9KPS5_9BACT|nr:GIY-YIG nuclease family protein [Terrimonas ginsenosidimutans]MCG2614333.1 GIY-YIG nuclease family protein [Terrimonas ginsenosidimutans]
MTNINRTVLYVGVTSNLDVRIWQHKTGQSKFTARNKCNRLVYIEPYTDIRVAKRREWLLKRWRREWKIELITKANPFMEDLARDWYPSLRGK